MRDTDVRVVEADAVFRDVRLETPFVISGRPIDRFTIGKVDVLVESRAGMRARGHGQAVLSVPWAWPHSHMDGLARDALLRDLVREYATRVLDLPLADPIQAWRWLTDDLDATLASTAEEAPPRLAGLLAVGAVDNAVHDAWGQAAGRSALAMCSADHMSTDLSWADPQLQGIYPADALVAPNSVLPVQHVVGVGDPLSRADQNQGTQPGAVRDLETWMRLEAPRFLKIKVTGEDPIADSARVAAIHDVAARYQPEVRLAIDPNEGCATPLQALELVEEIGVLSSAARDAIDYMEQPVPRSPQPEPGALQELTAVLPTVLDEGFDRLSQVSELKTTGWSGVVIKASKGQTPAMVAAAVARAKGAWLLVQDLTASSWAHAHSARLLSELDVTRRQLEFNSRQYAPAANADFRQRFPGLVTVADGSVRLPRGDGVGLYGFR